MKNVPNPIKGGDSSHKEINKKINIKMFFFIVMKLAIFFVFPLPRLISFPFSLQFYIYFFLSHIKIK